MFTTFMRAITFIIQIKGQDKMPPTNDDNDTCFHIAYLRWSAVNKIMILRNITQRNESWVALLV